MLKPPTFWYHPRTKRDHLVIKALAPLGHVYSWATRQRFDMHFPAPLSRPVVCIGNLTMGGAGKTPTALSICGLLKNKGFNPHFLTRGYGGREEGPIQVSPGRDTAADVGDEALLLMEEAPTWVSKNRPQGAQQAIYAGANVIIMDDGYQNPSLYKNFALVVIDGGVGFGNGHVFPAGPLREDLSFGLERADAVVIIGEDKTNAVTDIQKHTSAAILQAHLTPAVNNPDIKGKEIYAFAGIGRPEKFKETLESAGTDVEGWKAFPDHFTYSEEDLKDFIDDAGDKIIATTAKDFVRLPESLRSRIKVFAVELTWDNPETLSDLIDQNVEVL